MGNIRVVVSNSVDLTIWQNFKKLSKNMEIPASRLLDEAMVDLMKKKGGATIAGN